MGISGAISRGAFFFGKGFPMTPQYYQQQVKLLADKAANDRDQDGDREGRWQQFVDALVEAYDRACDLSVD